MAIRNLTLFLYWVIGKAGVAWRWPCLPQILDIEGQNATATTLIDLGASTL